ncbi:Adho101-like protein [Cryptophlebia peltastica nucleopolyhedrovirus]|uniref:Adho101-like protein n=1 Tax=Cryptophlebia peltastica nucleopolyhedrovirus TaxID=2304025 RepID=A0A346RNX4_9ABAC|nr:Adho101-like protein [Cryptophlebia peltastica nucleopolyhedrovirus]AXS67771.1 Adho101-like protein [Cryptophlebia peltastica nucleopolyhedrovirus]
MNYNHRDVYRRRYDRLSEKYNAVLHQHENLKSDLRHLKMQIHEVCRNSVGADNVICERILNNTPLLDNTIHPRNDYTTALVKDKTPQRKHMYNDGKPLVSVEPFD